MSYQFLEKYRDERVDKILREGSKSFRSGQNNYIKGLGETEKRKIKELIVEHIKLDKLETDSPEVFVETEMHSAAGHLDNLLSHLEGDIFPLLSKTDGKAPFTVLRNVLCYCDCIARLQYGRKGSSGDLDQLFDHFGPYEYIQKRYRRYKKYLVQVYRHELVHTVRPWSKVMFVKDNNNLSLSYVRWSVTGQLNTETQSSSNDFQKLKKLLAIEGNRKNLVHLGVDRHESESPVIIINTYCFLFDLVNYIEELKKKPGENDQLKENFMKNLIEIIVESSFRLLRHNVPTLDLDDNKSV